MCLFNGVSIKRKATDVIFYAWSEFIYVNKWAYGNK